MEETTPKVETTDNAASTPNGNSSKLVQWWVGLLQKFAVPPITEVVGQVAGPHNPFAQPAEPTAKDDAKNRLKLVLMHDRTQLSPTLLESMRDELVQVISKYVEIDQTSLDLCLEQESNTIALVANISVVRSRPEAGDDKEPPTPPTAEAV